MSHTNEQSRSSGISLIEMDRVVSRREAADFLGVCIVTMDRWHRDGTGPAWVQLGKRRGGYTLRSLQNFVQEREAVSRGQRAA